MQGCESTVCTVVLGSAPPCGFASLCIYGAVLSQRPVQVAASPNATFTRIFYMKYLVDDGELGASGYRLLFTKQHVSRLISNTKAIKDEAHTCQPHLEPPTRRVQTLRNASDST